MKKPRKKRTFPPAIPGIKAFVEFGPTFDLRIFINAKSLDEAIAMFESELMEHMVKIERTKTRGAQMLGITLARYIQKLKKYGHFHYQHEFRIESEEELSRMKAEGKTWQKDNPYIKEFGSKKESK